MKISHRFNSNTALRGGSYFVLTALLVPIVGCGHGADNTPPTSSGPAPAGMQPAANKPPLGGITTTQKVVLLAGAAALVYYYEKSKKDTAKKYAGQSIQYYKSKNGGIYYRDPTTHAFHFVTAPATNYSVKVPETEAQAVPEIQQAQGYDGKAQGNGLDYYFKPAPTGGA